MENKDKIKKEKWLHIRLDEEQHKQVLTLFCKTTERKLSTYARKVLLSVPVTVTYRNLTVDQSLAVLSKLQADLNGLCNNYNQMVHKLHLSDHVPELLDWVNRYEKEKQLLFDQVSKVKEFINENAAKWLL